MTDVFGEIAQITAAIRANRFRYSCEDRLQEGIALALGDAGIAAEREFRLGSADRIDMLAGRVGIEVKVAGTPGAVARQLRRYAASPDLDALVLVTTRARHRSIAGEMDGKPVSVVFLSGVTG